MAARPREPFLDEVASPESPNIDFVFVHGLNPHGKPDHAYETWTHTDKTHKVLWPKDFLSHEFHKARILIFGYNSNVTKGVSEANIPGHANSLLNRLQHKRIEKEYSNIPIVFFAHSLGGLVVKQALLDAQNKLPYQPIFNATRGLVFFGTPHKGGNTGGATTFAAKMKKAWERDSANNILLKCLKQNSAFTQDITRRFVDQQAKYAILTFYETVPTKFKGFSQIIVSQDSAILNVPNEVAVDLNRDHRTCCKFATKEDGYNTVSDNLDTVLEQILGQRQRSINHSQTHLIAGGIVNASAGSSLSQEIQQARMSPQIHSSRDTLMKGHSTNSLRTQASIINPRVLNERFLSAVRRLDTALIYSYVEDPAVRAEVHAELIQSAVFELASAKEKGEDLEFRDEAFEIILKECNLDLECRDSRNKATPLIIAASSGRKSFVKLLIGKNANLQAVDGELGRTALSWAAKYNAPGCVKILLTELLANQDVDTIQSRDIDGRTALDIARERRHFEIVEMIEHYIEVEVRDKDAKLST